MCITFFYLNTTNTHPIKFILAFNRDQQSQRKTLPFSQFADDPNIYAGLDILSGGSWLGINIKTGIFVFLTNYRKRRLAKSRGTLVKIFLSTSYLNTPQYYTNPQDLNNKIYQDLTQILKNPQQYSPFNLSIYNIRGNKIFYICSENYMEKPMVLINNYCYGLSNSDIKCNWNKVVKGKSMFNIIINNIYNNQYIENQQIFQQMEHIMKNSDGSKCCLKFFQSSIFIRPYYSYLFKTNRMTRSTIYAIFKNNSQGKIQAHIRQVSYHEKQNQTQVQFNFTI